MDWFKSLEKEAKSRFIQFDIESFYPSITSELLNKALEYAKSIVHIEQEDVNIIQHSRKSLLFSGQDCWIKKDNDLFDVTMGAYDGAEVCELVGLYLLKKIAQIIPQSNVGLYRDDGLAAISNANGPKLDKIRKKLHEIFKAEKLKIVVQVNMIEVDFLDVHLCMQSGTFRPFMKPNNTLQYIHADSNHPKNITKNIPTMIERRLSGLSSTRDIFEEDKKPYEEALKLSGYDTTLSYHPQSNKPNKNNRRRKILWFNPPFSNSVATNVGREFLKILERNFPKNHKYYKIFNKNTVKVSYSCMPNISNIIKGHNSSMLKPEQKTEENPKGCNCRKKELCPMNGQCLTECIVYEGTISNGNSGEKYKYIGQTEGEFKTRFYNHSTSFRNENYAKKTELSKKYWEIKNQGGSPEITWKILRKVRCYENGQRHCNLCLTEKLLIITCKDEKLLNSRSEISSKCRHKRKYLLSRL